MTTSPPANFSAVSKLSVNRFCTVGFTTNLSTTTAMLCLIFFSNLISSCRSYTIPSIFTLPKPLFLKPFNSLTYSPFLPRTTGALTRILLPSGSCIT